MDGARASLLYLTVTIQQAIYGHHVVTSRTVDMVASKANTWVWLEQSYVQILVVVATIQMRTLKTDVEKGSMWTAIGHGSVSPKMRSKEGSERGISIHSNIYSIQSKGKQVNILVLSAGDCLISCQTYVVTQTSSNTSQVVLERVFSSLLLHQTTLESVQLEIGFKWR
jgi:hypothetical protein